MTPEEVARVLAAAAGRDNRKVGTVDVLAWLQDIGDLDPDDALAAVSQHYRESTDRVMPAHIRRLAHEIGRERRRVEREAGERLAIEAERADPTRRDRSEATHDLIRRLRDSLPDSDPDKLHRAEWIEIDRRRGRTEEPNPNFIAPPPPGGHPIETPDADPT